MPYYGRRLASDTDMGATGSGSSNQRGQIYVAMSENGWAKEYGILGGKAIGQPNLTLRGAIYDVDGTTLDLRHIYTGPVTVSNAMSFGGDGQWITQSLIGFQMLDGTKYGLAFAVTGGIFHYGMKEAAANPTLVSDYNFHTKSVGTSTPTDPFGATSVTNEGAIDQWVEYETNVAPTVTDGTMAPSGNITDTSPTFEGDWDDANWDVGDLPKQFHIHVRPAGGGTLLWNTTQSFSGTEQDDRRFAQVYGGTALTPGSSYEWRYQVSDQFDTWSDWSDYETFTIAGAGSVNVSSGTPTGKQETQSPTPFTGVWSNTGALSTNAVEVRVKQGGTVIRSSPTISKVVANNATISITWAESTFAALSWGSSLTYSIRGRSSTGIWSEWSSERAFTINASPTIPSGLTPTGGAVSSSRPLLQCVSTDTDDTTGSGLSVTARIKDAAGALLQTRTMIYNAGLGKWEYQTLSADLAAPASFKWDARATDGTVTTAYSSEASFVYGTGPVVTVVAPTAAQVLTTHTPTFSFTQDSTQVSYGVAIYVWDAGLGTTVGDPVLTAGPIADAKTAGLGSSFTVPSGVLHNGGSYAVYFTSTNNLALSGTSAARLFSLSFPVLPAPTGVVIEAIPVGNDVVASAVRITLDEPPYATDYFEGTYVWRHEAGQSLANAVLLADPLSVSQRTFTDYRPRSGVTYVYTTYFGVRQGTDSTETEHITGEAGVVLEHVVINSVNDGELRAGLRYGQPMTLAYNEDTFEVPIWGQDAPHIFVGDTDQKVWQGTFELQDDRYSSAADDLLGLRELRAERSTVCYRDWQGTLIFGKLAMQETIGAEGNKGAAALTIRQNDYVEGVASG